MFHTNFSARPIASTSTAIAASNNRKDRGKSIARSHVNFSTQLQFFLHTIQNPPQWNINLHNLIFHLIVRSPIWPQERALSIFNKQGQEIYVFVPPKGRRQLSSIRLLQEENYYAVIIDDTHQTLAINADNDNLYNAVLGGLKGKIYSPTSARTITATANQLREYLANYIYTHPYEVEQLLNQNTIASDKVDQIQRSLHQHDPLPSIYARPSQPSPAQIRICEIINAYYLWTHKLTKTQLADNAMFSQGQAIFLNKYQISWLELEPYIHLKSHKKIRGTQLQEKVNGYQFDVITAAILKECQTYLLDKKACRVHSISQFAAKKNVLLEDLEKFCTIYGTLTLYGEQALALHEGKQFSPIMPDTINKYLHAHPSFYRPSNAKIFLETFCRQENILLEEFERHLINNQLLLDESDLLSRYPKISAVATPAQGNTAQLSPSSPIPQAGPSFKPSPLYNLAYMPSSISRKESFTTPINTKKNSLSEPSKLVDNTQFREQTRLLNWSTLDNSPALSSIYATPSQSPAAASKITVSLLNAYHTWHDNLPKEIIQNRYDLIKKRNIFLKKHKISWAQIQPYFLYRKEGETLRAIQLQEKQDGHQFNLITPKILKKLCNYLLLQPRARTSAVAIFAKAHNLFLDDLERFCNRDGTLTLYGEQALALHAGKIFYPITPAIIKKYFQFAPKDRYRSANQKITLEAFCKQENILLEELEVLLIKNHRLVDDTNMLGRYEEAILRGHPTATSFHPLASIPTISDDILLQQPSTSKNIDTHYLDTPIESHSPIGLSPTTASLPPIRENEAIRLEDHLEEHRLRNINNPAQFSPISETNESDSRLEPSLLDTTYLQGQDSISTSYIDLYLSSPININLNHPIEEEDEEIALFSELPESRAYADNLLATSSEHMPFYEPFLHNQTANQETASTSLLQTPVDHSIYTVTSMSSLQNLGEDVFNSLSYPHSSAQFDAYIDSAIESEIDFEYLIEDLSHRDNK